MIQACPKAQDTNTLSDHGLPDKSEGFSGEMIWQGLKVTYAVLNNNNRHTQAVNTMLLIPF